MTRLKRKKMSGNEGHAVDTSSIRYMTATEKKMRMKSLQAALQMKIRRREEKIASLLEKEANVTLDSDVSADFQNIMDEEDWSIEENFAKDSFQYIFWKQQKEALRKKGDSRKGIRWHPLTIKWCIYLRHHSNKAYETLRDSGCVSLPSQRTLREYTHAVKGGPGIPGESDHQLYGAAHLASLPLFSLIDEVHIKQDDKHAGIIGFLDLGDINNHFARFEELLSQDDDDRDTVAEASHPPLAKSMVVFMVRGLFTNLKYPYSQYPCSSLSREQMFLPFWETVCHLERIGFKVGSYTIVYNIHYPCSCMYT